MIAATLEDGYTAPPPSPAPSSDPLVGRLIQGRYRVMKPLGKGGMGLVYEAQHVLTGRKVALKTLSAWAAFSPGCWARFQREAQAAVAADSAHVVDVLDMGELEDGMLYIVLEHLNGADLAFTVARDGPFGAARAARILVQLCDALSAVHAAGIVHRDLKPENVILIERHGVCDFVKVLDFGVCKFGDGGGARLTGTGDTLGTPPFMAPEQVEGRRDLDSRADIYALGAILFFLLTGRAPFEDQNLSRLFISICKSPVPSLRTAVPDADSRLDAVVQRALQKRPSDRYSSCAELKEALLPFAYPADEEEPAKVAPPVAPGEPRRRGSETEQLIRALRLQGVGFWSVAGTSVALLVVALISFVAFSRASAARTSPAGAEAAQARDTRLPGIPLQRGEQTIEVTPGAPVPASDQPVSSTRVEGSAEQ